VRTSIVHESLFRFYINLPAVPVRLKCSLETHQVVVNLVGSTKTNEGLEVHCWLDEGQYKTGRKVTDNEMESIRLKRNSFHGDWNYEIQPHKNKQIR
jgi:hypothetical protein